MNRKGFTLVEILAVVAILGILSGIGIQAYSRYKEKAKQQAYDTMAKSSSLAAEEYFMDHPYDDDVSLTDLYTGGYLNNIIGPTNEECTGRVKLVNKAESEGDVISTDSYSVSVCCSSYTYTYRYPEDVKVKDIYCKADPFSMEQLQETITSIKVLNVYPTAAVKDNFTNWMNSFGKGMINVTAVSVEDFNTSYNTYLGSPGNWNYDIVVFGFADCYGSKDLSAGAASAMATYLDAGKPVVFGHDTLTVKGCGSHKNFNTLASYVNMELGTAGYQSSTEVKIVRKGVFTEYPWKIGDVGTILDIPRSHVYGQIAHGDIWITFNGMNDIDSNKIYLSTWNNTAFIQTGHSGGEAKSDEQKILANIVFYMVAKQYIGD